MIGKPIVSLSLAIAAFASAAPPIEHLPNLLSRQSANLTGNLAINPDTSWLSDITNVTYDSAATAKEKRSIIGGGIEVVLFDVPTLGAVAGGTDYFNITLNRCATNWGQHIGEFGVHPVFWPYHLNVTMLIPWKARGLSSTVHSPIA